MNRFLVLCLVALAAARPGAAQSSSASPSVKLARDSLAVAQGIIDRQLSRSRAADSIRAATVKVTADSMRRARSMITRNMKKLHGLPCDSLVKALATIKFDGSRSTNAEIQKANDNCKP